MALWFASFDAPASDAFWASHIEPLLKEHCTECHNATKTKSGLDLSSLQTILRGGERGSSVIPGHPDESNLFKFLSAEGDPHMPPGKRKSLSDEEIALVKKWIMELPMATPSALAGGATNASGTSLAATVPKARLTWKPSATMPPSQVVDRFLELAWKLDKVIPVKRAEDTTFVRRIYLDLAGRIPTETETVSFLQDHTREKRARLIESLLAGDEYPRQMREVFDAVLMSRRGAEWEEKRVKQKWFDFLEDSFRRNRPWNDVVRDLIVARPERPEDRGAVWYLYERQNNAQSVAEALAPVVFGVQIKCAQCHDHMIAREIKQAHYWGMVAAFNRSKNVETPNGPGVAESAIGGFTSFANLRKESQPALLTFFNGRKVEEGRPKEGEKEIDSPDLYWVPPGKASEAQGGPGGQGGKGPRRPRTVKADQPAVPKFSRRQEFADAVTRDNPLLARAMVNRVWAMLFGRGLVHPVELMDSKHPPSHPELLDWLARDFEQSNYDVKRLVRTLCNTRAYQLDSRSPDVAGRMPPAKRSVAGSRTSDAVVKDRAGASGNLGQSNAGNASQEKPVAKGRPIPLDSFARALDKPLSAEQLFRTMLMATGNGTGSDGKVGGPSEKELRGAFVAQFPDIFPTEYNATLYQAMFLSNSPLFDRLLAARGDNLTARLLALPEAEARVRVAFGAVFGREPDRDERLECAGFLTARSKEAGVKQLLWAMLSSAEFQLNH